MFDRTKISLVIAIVLCAVASPYLAPTDKGGGMNPYFYDILIGVGISIILATGLNLVNGYTGQFSLGHAGFMAMGAYFAGAMTTVAKFPYLDLPAVDFTSWTIIYKGLLYALGGILNGTFWLHNTIAPMVQSWPPWAAILGALLYGGVVAAICGYLVGIPSLRLRGDYLAIVTLGFNEIIKVMIQNAEPLGAQRGLSVITSSEPTAEFWKQSSFFWTFAFAALTIFVVLNLVHSTYGRGFLAVRDDEIAAEAMGINTTKYKVLAFVIAAFFAGIAGGLYAHFKQFIHPEGFNFMRSVDIVVMVILGGMGNTVGVILAAIILTILPELLRHVAGIESLPEWTREMAKNRMILYSLLLIALMLLRPQGLFGGWKRKKGEPKAAPVK